MKIDTTYLININGVKQKIRLLGTSENNPVILFVHGGPGNPNRHKIRKYLSSLTSKYTLAAYDQRGTGGSYAPILKKTGLSVEDMVDDVIGWAKWLEKKFYADKVYIVGESFGSYLSTLALIKAPEHFKAYIGYGQVYDFDEDLLAQYEMAYARAEELQDDEAIEFLDYLGYPSNWSKEEKKAKMDEFSSLFYPLVEGEGFPSYEEREIKPFLRSREYTLSDKDGWRKGSRFSSDWFAKIVFEGTYPSLKESDGKIDIPYYVFAGKYDYVTPYSLSKKWFKKVVAPKKEFITFDYSAHLPAFEEPTWFKHELRRLFK